MTTTNTNTITNNIPNTNNNLIPKKIYQTWHSTNIPIGMYKSIVHLKKINPEFEYYLFNDNDCRKFIRKHYGISVLKAFDRLIPGA